MKIVAFLQNQWFKEPERIKAIYLKHPEMRNELNKRFLFMGCRTGKILLDVFGRELCDGIVWENASDFMGDHSASRFGHDEDHIHKVMDTEKPDVVLTFGAVARDGVQEFMDSNPLLFSKIKVLMAPHPTARGKGIKEKIVLMSGELRKHLTTTDSMVN